MRLSFYHTFCFILLTISFSGSAFGQMINVNADTVVITSQVSSDSSIYVFYTNSTGTLKARCPVPGPVTYEWLKYDTIAHAFNIPTTYTDSVASNLASGGYQVHMTAPGYDNRFAAWVYIDKPAVTLEKDKLGNIKYTSYTCDHTDLSSNATQSNLICYNKDGKKQSLPSLTYLWSADPEVPFYPYDNKSSIRLDTTRLPLVKASFFLQVKDAYGAISQKDTAKYSPIIAKAIIAPPVYDTSHVVDGNLNSAPMKVSFGNLSKNSVSYIWYIAYSNKLDTFQKATSDSLHQTFYLTGVYNVKLVAQSLQLCTDTTQISVTIAEGRIGKNNGTGTDTSGTPSPPNLFVADGSNYYKIYNVSIRHFRITIYSRWGRKVYSYEGDDMLNAWKGWDGTIGNSRASSGVYFYVLEVMSWDKVPDKTLMNPKGQYSGFFYLFWRP